MKNLQVLVFCLLFFTSFSLARTIIVKTPEELKAADAAARPGDTIQLRNGEWRNIKIVLTAKGTENKPVVYKAEKNGEVKITGKSSLRINGSYLVIDGLYFTNGGSPEGSVWEFRHNKQVANHCRITNCIIESFNKENRFDDDNWIALYGKNNRVDHCSFFNKTNMGVLLAVVLDDDRSRLNEHSIDSNYFGYRKPLGSNGGEIIRVGVSQHCTFYSNTNIRNNFFEYCDGETEIVSIKSCGNKVTGNVFKESQGSVVLRHGNNNTVEGNLFWGNNKKATGGVRVINEGNWVVNNFFSGLRGEGFKSPLAIMNGIFNSPPHRYLPVKDAVIINNTFAHCAPVSLGEGSDEERTIAPENVYFYNNLFLPNPKDTQLAYISSKTNGYHFSNNVINKELKNTPAGFAVQPFEIKTWNSMPLPEYKQASALSGLPDSILKQGDTRLIFGFGTNSGVHNSGYFKALLSNAKNMGARFKPAPKTMVQKGAKMINCKNGTELARELEKNIGNRIVIRLTGSYYEFKNPLRINSTVTLTGSQNEIYFSSKSKLPNLFQVKGSNHLTFNNVRINASGLKTDHFIIADSSDDVKHFALIIKQSSFKNLSAQSFFKAGKTSYADSIVVTSSSFINNKASLFNLTEEKENKGYYNVENMKIAGNRIENHKGPIMEIYRGGNDESTLGPMVIFSGNKITNASHDQALIDFFGVQESLVSKNTFINANPGKSLVKYTDIVKAKHFQFKNSFSKSGIIAENKFVTNL